MVCEFCNNTIDFFLSICRSIKKFFTCQKGLKSNSSFVDLELGLSKSADTMCIHPENEDEVQQFPNLYKQMDFAGKLRGNLGYGKDSNELPKEDWSMDSDDLINEEILADEFTQKCAIEGNGDKSASFEGSDVDVSDEVGSEPETEQLLDLNEITEIPTVAEIKSSKSGEQHWPVLEGLLEKEKKLEPEVESADNSDLVQVEGVDIENLEIPVESSDDEDLEIPTMGGDSDEEKSKRGPKILTQKLKWEAKASVPKYTIIVNNKLNKDDILKASITTKGKAEKLAKAKTEINQEKAKFLKDQFKKEFEDKRTADQIARAKIVEKERERVAEAKKKRELAAEKVKKEAAERYQREKLYKEKERAEADAKRKEFNQAKLQAINSSKNGNFK